MPKTTTRPKGYKDWDPSVEVSDILDKVQVILDEYRSYGAMTARQIFYRLVAEHDYPKTERAYKNLANYLVKARRAEIISFYDIRDDSSVVQGGGGYPSVTSFWNTVRYSAERFTLDKQLGQPFEIELWCEAKGMAGMLADMVAPYDIPVYSTGGFSSVTVIHETAMRIARSDRPTVMLHVGDYDPSGESIFLSMAQDIGAFVAEEINADHVMEDGTVPNPYYDGDYEDFFEPRRVLVTADLVAEHNLTTAPPKATDSRSANWQGGTVQAEAMAPPLMQSIIGGVVEEYIDDAIYAEICNREARYKEEIRVVIDSALGRKK